MSAPMRTFVRPNWNFSRGISSAISRHSTNDDGSRFESSAGIRSLYRP
eukprot:COSAG05_NODE_48_length_24425_cov_90.438543_10_plen_48_part_00